MVTREIFGVTMHVPQLIASADPATNAMADRSGLGASITRTLSAGDYFVVVRSHGNYGDIRQYTVASKLPGALTPIIVTPAAGLVSGF